MTVKLEDEYRDISPAPAEEESASQPAVSFTDIFAGEKDKDNPGGAGEA